MNYRQAIRYLESLINYENIPAWNYKDSLKPSRFESFLGLVGNPHRDLKVVHIAGTKGKGSTCAFCAYMLRENGYSTGLYTSPHLHDFRERIRILRPEVPESGRSDFEGMIPGHEISRLTFRLAPLIDEFNRSSVYGPLTFFEVYTGLAMLYFREQGVDIVVLETGMGGRLDATNVVCPLVCAITPISYEHTQKLGKTIAKIAGEKAGIIKRCNGRSPVVISSPQRPEAREVIRARCNEIGACLREVGRDIRVRPEGSSFRVTGRMVFSGLRPGLIGAHQAVNAACALGVIEALGEQGWKFTLPALKRGISCVRWPGRCELIGKAPRVLLDGAQNAASAMTLRACLKKDFRYRRLIMVFGVSSDKDISGICRVLKPIADEVILTKADNARAVDPAALARHFLSKKIRITRNIKEARRTAFALSGERDLILVCGSLFVVGEFRDEILN